MFIPARWYCVCLTVTSAFPGSAYLSLQLIPLYSAASHSLAHEMHLSHSPPPRLLGTIEPASCSANDGAVRAEWRFISRWRWYRVRKTCVAGGGPGHSWKMAQTGHYHFCHSGCNVCPSLAPAYVDLDHGNPILGCCITEFSLIGAVRPLS